MAVAYQKCVSCKRPGFFQLMHNGDSACCHCDKISKEHEDITQPPKEKE